MTNSAILLVFFLSVRVATSSTGYNEVCAKKIKEVARCFYNAPQDCEHWSKNKLLVCAKEAAEDLSRCNDEIAFKIIDFQIASYRITDAVLCHDNVTAEITEDDYCLHAATGVSTFWSILPEDFLTPKGCRFFKTYIYSQGYSFVPPECYFVVDYYLSKILNLSNCGVYERQIPTIIEFQSMNFVYDGAGSCVYFPNSLPGCSKRKKSKVVRCVESWTKGRILNPNLKSIEDNIIKVAKKRDEVFCNRTDIKTALREHHKCADQLWEIDWRLIEKTNGYFTNQGCEALKYYEYIWISDVMSSDCFFFRTYWNLMNAALKCGD